MLLLSKILALVGTVLLCWTFVLSSRIKFLEKILGGLDKVTKIHHIVGGVAFVLLISHPIFLALSVLPDFNLAAKYLFLSNNIIYNYGVMALYLMILLLFLTLIIKLPYHIWIKTHDFFGVVLLFASLHIFFINSDVSRNLILRIFMFINLGIGIFFYIYKVFWDKLIGQKYDYIVEEIVVIGDVLEIYLKPVGEKIKFVAGQFGFVSFEQKGLTEAHPFSFSSSPDDDLFRFSIKILGDYTMNLKNLKTGTKCKISSAYGKISEGFWGNKDVVCIAGGIGVTPFLSMMGYEKNHILPRKISLFYSSREENKVVYNDDFINWQNELPNFSYYPYFGEKRPRLTAQILRENLGSLDNKIFYLCGPSGMMHDISAQLQMTGVKLKNIIFEDFNFKP